LRKLEVQVLAYLEENADERVHTHNFNELNLLTYLLFQFPVAAKHSR